MDLLMFVTSVLLTNSSTCANGVSGFSVSDIEKALLLL
uniref:Myb-related protein 330-like n=1 Tax=Rhizophora mucronata TaxID=61149 RepID=A0A2P2N6Y0_RHIMU